MNKKEFKSVLKTKLQELADPTVKEKVERLTFGAKCVGVTVPNLRALAKSLKTENKITVEQAIEFFDFIAPNMCHEEILVAIFILANMSKKQLCFDWSHKENLKKLLPYTKSKNLWIRRFAVATAANSNHGGFYYPEQTLEICNALKDEKKPMVKKTITWALHEVQKTSKKL